MSNENIKKKVGDIMKKRNDVVAKVMKNIARKSVEMAVDSRCMYVLHQPKQPKDIKKFK